MQYSMRINRIKEIYQGEYRAYNVCDSQLPNKTKNDFVADLRPRRVSPKFQQNQNAFGYLKNKSVQLKSKVSDSEFSNSTFNTTDSRNQLNRKEIAISSLKQNANSLRFQRGASPLKRKGHYLTVISRLPFCYKLKRDK